ncbi:alpha/beta hydrolase [Micromonospora sp. STR1s_5]|nr:alpha/beta hydrolase [Micromonospora sp. STR1s_5]
MLDPDMVAVLERLRDAPAMETMSLAELRAGMLPMPPESRPAVGRIEDRVLPGNVPVRLYRPEAPTRGQLMVYFHGGGFVIGNLETHDHVARDLCRAAGCTVMSVDYRLAPEHRFPAGVEDCLTSTEWAFDNAISLGCSPAEIVLAGDSAGATLAAVTALKLRDAGRRQVSGQVLVYPVTDYHTPPTRSYLENGAGFSLTRGAMIRFWDEYLASPDQARHPDASPLNADDLGRLPPTLIFTAEFDPLRDEGEAFAAKLERHGTPVDLVREAGLIHGFLRMAATSRRAREVFSHIGEWVGRLPPAGPLPS